MADINSTQTGAEKCSSSTNRTSRRNFIIRAAVVPPVITTLASRPAWGLGVCGLSGVLSGNLSNHDHSTPCTGPEGKSPGYWWQFTKAFCKNKKLGKKVIYQWSKTGYLPHDSFSSVFGSVPTQGQGNTLGQVILTVGVPGGFANFERHVVAAFLSVSHPDINTPYTLAQVKEAYTKALAEPSGSPVEQDIIAAFEALFTDHVEPSLSNSGYSTYWNTLKLAPEYDLIKSISNC